MKNEIFREIGYWGSLSAAVLTLINCVLCVVKGIKEFNTELEGNFIGVLTYPAEHGYYSLLFKICVGILGFSILMMIISFFMNTDGAIRIIMIIVKMIQIASVGAFVFMKYVMKDITLSTMMVIIFIVMELIAFVLYLVERNYRKTILRVAAFTIWTLGFGVIFLIFSMILLGVLSFTIVSFMCSLFGGEPEYKTAIVDLNGKIVGWLKRE